jgi:opacity protein-like surface antigen
VNLLKKVRMEIAVNDNFVSRPSTPSSRARARARSATARSSSSTWPECIRIRTGEKTLDIFTPYAFLGLSYVDTEVTPNKRSRAIQDDMTDVMLAGGVSVAPTEQLSLYVEVALIELTEWIDDVFVGAGVRWAF